MLFNSFPSNILTSTSSIYVGRTKYLSVGIHPSYFKVNNVVREGFLLSFDKPFLIVDITMLLRWFIFMSRCKKTTIIIANKNVYIEN